MHVRQQAGLTLREGCATATQPAIPATATCGAATDACLRPSAPAERTSMSFSRHAARCCCRSGIWLATICCFSCA